jgi:hypothetical protein
MPVRLRNRSFTLLTVELNSGDSVHLAPDETSRELDDIEVRDNPWIAKLERRAAVTVETAQRRTPPRRRGRTSTRTTRGRKGS